MTLTKKQRKQAEAELKVTVKQKEEMETLAELQRVKRALMTGVSFAEADDHGCTALMLGVRLKRNAIVKTLIADSRVDINLQDNCWGNTALFSACVGNNLEVLKMLVAHDKMSSLNTRDKLERTPLMVAVQLGYEDIVRELANTPGVDLNATDMCGEGLEDIARLVNSNMEHTELMIVYIFRTRGYSTIVTIVKEARAKQYGRMIEHYIEKVPNREKLNNTKKDISTDKYPDRNMDPNKRKDPNKICWKCHLTEENKRLPKCRGCHKVFLNVFPILLNSLVSGTILQRGVPERGLGEARGVLQHHSEEEESEETREGVGSVG